jgi:hypothetical protein
MRMLAGHPQVLSRPEPHLMGPLAHLGYWARVDKAPYDQHQAADAIRSIVPDLPAGEADYWAACRAYADGIYGPLLASSGRRYFLDKTPANALVLPFIERVYPDARYVVLTRHPAAVFASYANSFFDGDYESAHRFNPILERYVPAMAHFLRAGSAPRLQVAYEALVAEPERELQRICDFLDLPFDPGLVRYGNSNRHFQDRGLGDPLGVRNHDRPHTASLHKWVGDVLHRPAAAQRLRAMVGKLDDADLQTWGYPREEFWSPLNDVPAGAPAQRRWLTRDRWIWQRRILLFARRRVRRWPLLQRLLRRLRLWADVLLRG